MYYCAFVKYFIWICFEWIGCDVEVTLKENDIVPSHKRNIFHLRSYIFHLIYCPARVSQQMAARDHGRMLKDKRSNNCDRIYFLSDPSPIIGYACHSLPDSLTDWLLFSKLDWCDPGMWRWQLKTCWSCWWWETVYSVTISIQFLPFWRAFRDWIRIV